MSLLTNAKQLAMIKKTSWVYRYFQRDEKQRLVKRTTPFRSVRWLCRFNLAQTEQQEISLWLLLVNWFQNSYF